MLKNSWWQRELTDLGKYQQARIAGWFSVFNRIFETNFASNHGSGNMVIGLNLDIVDFFLDY